MSSTFSFQKEKPPPRLGLPPSVAQWLERPLGVREAGVDPRPHHTKDVKNGRFALLSLALGINELGIRLGGSELL